MNQEKFKKLLDELDLRIHNYRTGQDDLLDLRDKSVDELGDYLPDATARSTFKILLQRGWTTWDALVQATTEY
jgi:hypothetical protein